MKAIVLAAGYATRLYPLTKNQPKPLLNVGDKPILEWIVEKLERVEEIEEILVVTNHKFYPMFEGWLRGYKAKKRIKIVNDGTLRDEDRLGAIGDLHFVLQEEGLKEDILLIAGDNLFGFSLREFLGFFKEKGSTILAFKDLKDKEKVANKFGVGVLDEEKRVIYFEDKPSEPRSTLAATCCYLIAKKDLKKIEEYVKVSEKLDDPGYFIRWLIERGKVYGFVFEEPWFDIGNFEGLEEANKFYGK